MFSIYLNSTYIHEETVSFWHRWKPTSRWRKYFLFDGHLKKKWCIQNLTSSPPPPPASAQLLSMVGENARPKTRLVSIALIPTYWYAFCDFPSFACVSYQLTGRKQAITINKTSSSECDLIYGVPQGSVLGRILFTCYTEPLGAIARELGLS